MKYRLYNYRRCPFCIRVRIVLYLKGIEYDVINEPLREWTEWMREWSASQNEKARVPILCWNENGHEIALPESNAINIMLDQKHGEITYTPEENLPTYQEMLSWFQWCDSVLKPQIDIFKYGKDRIFDRTTHDEETKTLEKLVAKLEQALKGKSYLLEERLTLADIAIIPFIRQIMRTREGEFSFQAFPRVLQWSAIILEEPWFTDIVMKK